MDVARGGGAGGSEGWEWGGEWFRLSLDQLFSPKLNDTCAWTPNKVYSELGRTSMQRPHVARASHLSRVDRWLENVSKQLTTRQHG